MGTQIGTTTRLYGDVDDSLGIEVCGKGSQEALTLARGGWLHVWEMPRPGSLTRVPLSRYLVLAGP